MRTATKPRAPKRSKSVIGSVPEVLTAVPEVLTIRQVCELLSCGRDFLDQWWKAGRFPSPFRLGTLVRWHRETVLAWVREKQAEANGNGNGARARRNGRNGS